MHITIQIPVSFFPAGGEHHWSETNLHHHRQTPTNTGNWSEGGGKEFFSTILLNPGDRGGRRGWNQGKAFDNAGETVPLHFT